MDVYADGAATVALRAPAGGVAGRAYSEGPARVLARSRSGHAYIGFKRTSKKRNRWKWHDHYSNEHWEMPINPNSQTSPHRAKGIQMFARNPTPTPNPEFDQGYARAWAQKIVPLEWSFSGVIRSYDFYRDFLHWRAKKHKVEVEDDLGRHFHVHVLDLELKEDYPAPGRVAYTWRYTYTCKTLLHRVTHEGDNGDDNDSMYDDSRHRGSDESV